LKQDKAKAALKNHLKVIYINSAKMVDYEQADGTAAQYLLVKIPFRSLGGFQKAGNLVQEALEQAFEGKPVIVVANRTIVSPTAKHHPTQMRPRSRCLTAVHDAILNDVVSIK